MAGPDLVPAAERMLALPSNFGPAPSLAPPLPAWPVRALPSGFTSCACGFAFAAALAFALSRALALVMGSLP